MRKAVHITALVFLLIAVASPVFAQDSTAPTVVDVEVCGGEQKDPQRMLDVIPIKVGDTYSPELMKVAVDYLTKWGVFDDISYDVTPAPGGVKILFNLTDAIIVGRVDVTGNYPYIENKVRKYLTLNAGDKYTPEAVEEQLDRLAEFYKREGFVDSDFSVSEEPGPEFNLVLLTFHIHRGRLLRYRTITIEGNHAYPDGRFVSAINTYKPYAEKRLRKSLRKLKEFYRLHGYPRVKIRIKEKKIDLDNDRVDLVLDIDEGPFVDIVFDGNKYISNSRLKKVITILREGSVDSYEVEQSVAAITNYYMEHSYPEIKVIAERKRQRDDLIVIIFSIHEGTPHYVKRVRFEGNEGVDDDKLEAGMLTKQHSIGQPGALIEQNIAKDTETIQTNLKKEGFLTAQIDPWEISFTKQGYAYDITIPIEEGAQTIVDRVTFNGTTIADEATLLKALKLTPGTPFNPLALEEDKEALKRFYADNGHPYAAVEQGTVIDTSGTIATITYTIVEGSEVRIGRILVVGDVLTSQKAIRDAMSLKEGEPFSYRKLVESQLNIRRLGAFSSVKVETIGIEDKQDVVHLKVSVDEERPFRLDLEAGYSTRDAVIGSLIFTNINSFGWAKKTFFKLTGGKKLSRVELGWRDPRFLSSSFEMTVITWLQHRIRPTFNYVQYGGTIGFFRYFERFNIAALQEITRNYFVEGDSVAADAESLRNNALLRTSMSASYDARDSFSDPTRGYYGFAKVDFFNEIRGANAHFVRFTAQAEYDLSFLSRLVLSMAGRFDHIQTIGSNVSVPTNERLFMGGADTVRGFAEDSLGPVDANGGSTGGMVRWIINEELRFRIMRSFQLAGFFDVGCLTNSYNAITLNNVRISAGVGIRYLTPVGPLRLDVGFPLDRRAGESNHRVHFTFGYVF